mgnify:CR=1 FL=1
MTKGPNISRRSAAALLGSLPFVGRQFGSGGLSGAAGSNAAEQSLKALGQQEFNRLSSSGAGQTMGPLMPEWKAMRLAMLDPDIKAIMMDALWNQHREIHKIDPDIEVLRSFSPMAKIAFQRQRNVQRAIEQSTNEPLHEVFGKARDYIRKLVWGDR